jgi:hypothetical protein
MRNENEEWKCSGTVKGAGKNGVVFIRGVKHFIDNNCPHNAVETCRVCGMDYCDNHMGKYDGVCIYCE